MEDVDMLNLFPEEEKEKNTEAKVVEEDVIKDKEDEKVVWRKPTKCKFGPFSKRFR